MPGLKLIINLIDGSKVWINGMHITKMVKQASGQYYIYLDNGETYSIDHSCASAVENFFQGR